MTFLPSEWHPQAFVQLTWPHEETDWAPVLADAIDCFCEIAREVAKKEPLLIAAQYPEEAKNELRKRGIGTDGITFVHCLTNDTWARDHAFLSCIECEGEKRKIVLQDYQFNGWGMKFAANYDNQINHAVLPTVKKLYEKQQLTVEYQNHLDFVFEGGSIESDGNGTLMVTSSCLLAENRNNTLSKLEIEEKLKHDFHAKKVIWIEHSWLEGDDTDGHIDTVARFCSPTSIAYVQCNDPADVHYEEMQAMEQELKALRTADGEPYTLFPLPFPSACFDDEGNRLPATYANFLVINGAVLMPTYAQPENDSLAMEQLRRAFPKHEIVPIDCRVLIIQHGSLHCSTMQFPIPA